MGTRMITKQDKSNFTFKSYRKIGTTQLSDQILEVGTEVETLEGKYVCQEPSRLAVDVAGNVYPVAESVFERCYILSVDKEGIS